MGWLAATNTTGVRVVCTRRNACGHSAEARRRKRTAGSLSITERSSTIFCASRRPSRQTHCGSPRRERGWQAQGTATHLASYSRTATSVALFGCASAHDTVRRSRAAHALSSEVDTSDPPLGTTSKATASDAMHGAQCRCVSHAAILSRRSTGHQTAGDRGSEDSVRTSNIETFLTRIFFVSTTRRALRQQLAISIND